MRTALAIVLVIAAYAVPLAAQDGAIEAQRLLTLGVEAFDAHDYDHALVELRQSLATVASPNTRLWIARALQQLGRNVEAAVEFQRTIRETRTRNEARYEATRSAASMEWIALSHSMGRIRFDPPLIPGIQVIAGGRAFSAEDAEESVAVAPGDVSVIVRDGSGRDAHEQRVAIAAGEVVTVHWQAREPARTTTTTEPTDSPGSSTSSSSSIAGFGWTSIGIGIGSLGAFGTLWLLTEREFEATRAACGPGAGRGCTEEQLAPGRSMQTATNVFLGIGIGATALGVLLEIVDLASHRGTPSATARWRFGHDGFLIRF